MARLCAHPHFVFPTKRPGSCFRSSFFTEKKPAWGPPYPRGTPNRCEFPRHMSAPTSPGGSNTHSASKSVATATRPCRNSTLNSMRGRAMLCCASLLQRGSSQPHPSCPRHAPPCLGTAVTPLAPSLAERQMTADPPAPPAHQKTCVQGARQEVEYWGGGAGHWGWTIEGWGTNH